MENAKEILQECIKAQFAIQSLIDLGEADSQCRVNSFYEELRLLERKVEEESGLTYDDL